MFDARSRPRAEVTHAIGRNECCAPLRIFPHLVPILRSIPRSPSWHADHHSACAACLTCQPVVSSCRGDILPHTTTLERLNRFTNSGDISFTTECSVSSSFDLFTCSWNVTVCPNAVLSSERRWFVRHCTRVAPYRLATSMCLTLVHALGPR